MFSGRKKKDLEIEVDESAEGAERSGKSRAGTAATTANSTLIPRWVQILHYVMHAVLLVIIILLIVAIALVESDARDDTDGTANKILRAFHLQVDGSVSNTFDCPGGSPAAASVADGGDVSSVCRANALGFVGHPYSSSGTIDGYDKYTNVEAFYYVDDEGSQWTYEMYKARLEPYCCGISEGPLKGDPPKIQAFMSGSRAIVYLEQKMDAYDSIRSYFTTLDCDADGKVINRIRYPVLDHENVRVEAAKLYYGMATGEINVSMFDTLSFSDDFVFSWNGGKRYGSEAAAWLRGLLEYSAPLRAETGFSFLPYFYYQQGFGTSSVIVKHQFFDSADNGGQLRSMGFLEFQFNFDDEITTLSYSESESNDRISVAHSFHEVFVVGSPLQGQYDTIDAIVTGESYELHMDGEVLGLEQVKAMLKEVYDADAIDDFSRSPPAKRRYFQVDGDRDSVYVLYSQTMAREDGTADPTSAIWRHVFEPATSDSQFAINPINKIRASYGFRTTDITSIAKAMDAFESMREFINGRSDSLDDFDTVPTTDDCRINTFWGGWTSFADFREGTVGYREWLMGTPDDPIYDADYLTVKKLVHAGRDVVVGLMTGYWVPSDWDRSQLYLASSLSADKMKGVIETNSDIFYFNTKDPASAARLSSLYMYNSTNY